MKKIYKILLGIIVVNVIVNISIKLVKKFVSKDDLEKLKVKVTSKLERAGINIGEHEHKEDELEEADIVETEELEVEFEN